MSKSLALSAARAQLKTLRATIAALSVEVKTERATAKADRIAAKEAKAAVRQERKAAKIAALEVKLLALKTGPVGTKARKANRRPSKVTVTKVA
jgi:hypothetical protein